jgi:hypothetical protein
MPQQLIGDPVVQERVDDFGERQDETREKSEDRGWQRSEPDRERREIIRCRSRRSRIAAISRCGMSSDISSKP